MARSKLEHLEYLSTCVRKCKNKTWLATKWGSRLTIGGGIKLSANKLTISRPKAQQHVSLLTVKSAKAVKGLIWSSIKVQKDDSTAPISVSGLKHLHAQEAVQAIQRSCTLANVRALQKILPRAGEIKKRIDRELEASAWLTQSQLSHMYEFVHSQFETTIPDWPRNAKETDALRYFSDQERITLVLALEPFATLSERATSHNRAFLREELLAQKHFFDTIEKNPLTDEQREAAITFDDNVLAIAAAGSGKTSTLVAKAGYAVKTGIAKPKQILLLAFNRDAAEELRQRVSQYLSKHIPDASDITVSTFHSFGLAVIGEATGKKPRVAPWVDQGNELKILSDIVDKLKEDERFAQDWKFFRLVYGCSLPKIGEEAEPDSYDPKSKRAGFRTVRGEIVKSGEERMIANWLAREGIDYQYEARYEHETATAQYSQYHPDFFYPGARLYHEHFGLNDLGHGRPGFPEYEDGVVWKRQLHEEKETPFIETTSHGIRQADGLDKLEAQLKAHGVLFDERPLTEQDQERLGDDASFLSLIRTFMIHVKSNHCDLSDLRRRSRDEHLGGRSHAGREQLFLDLFEQIWRRWDEMLSDGGYVDFEDMLTKAATHLDDGSFKSPYKLVMADEFQDTSIVRGKMLQALTKERGARLFVVGDDWQAINRFAGADISLMNDFERWFGHNTIVKLSKTFRCPKKLSELAAAFISKNPSQIDKTVLTVNPRTDESVLCYSVGDQNGVSALVDEHIRQLYQKSATSDSLKKSVIVMGRYWSDKPRHLPNWNARFQDRLNIVFSTVHGSKGLEADYVFLVNVTNGRKGFPSEIEDDPLLQLAMPAGEMYPHAEERRLFYVALTRAKEMIIIYTQDRRESEFLVELQNDRLIKIQRQGGCHTVKVCPACYRGSLVTKRSEYGQFLSCSRFPRCKYKK